MRDVSKKEILKNRIEVSSAKKSLVYFLINGSEIVYVGKTTMGISRVLSHCGTKEFDSYFTIDCDHEKLDETESNYIYKFEPRYNISLPENTKFISRNKLKKQYRVDGHAMRKVMALYSVKPTSLDCYSRDEIDKALTMAKADNILRYNPSTNSDWYLN